MQQKDFGAKKSLEIFGISEYGREKVLFWIFQAKALLYNGAEYTNIYFQWFTNMYIAKSSLQSRRSVTLD